MKKSIISLFMAVVMVISLTVGLRIAVSATEEHSEDDPRIIMQDGMGHEEIIWFQGLYTLPECPYTAPEGQRFKCWMIDGEEYLQPGDQTYTDWRTYITAVWEPLPVVSFAANGGAETMDPVATENEYALPECGFIAPNGQRFKAWLVDGQQKQPGDVITVVADIVVTAVWEELPTEIPTEATVEKTEVTTEAADVFIQNSGDNSGSIDAHWMIIALVCVTVVAVAAIVAAFIVALLALKKKKSE